MNSHTPFAVSPPSHTAAGQYSRASGGAIRNLAKLAAAAVCLGWLAGCSPNTPDAAIDQRDRYPFTVESKLVTQAVVFESDAVSLDAAEKDRLDVFLAHFMQSGGGALEIRQTAVADDKQAEARLQALRKHILKKGARPHEIRVRRIVQGDTDDGPIILSFQQYTANPINCPLRNIRTTANPKNTRHPNYGCSLRSGIAAMVSNPADLEKPRRMQPGDGMRRSRVIRNYRAGEPTEAARGENESSGSIRDLGG